MINSPEPKASSSSDLILTIFDQIIKKTLALQNLSFKRHLFINKSTCIELLIKNKAVPLIDSTLHSCQAVEIGRFHKNQIKKHWLYCDFITFYGSWQRLAPYVYQYRRQKEHKHTPFIPGPPLPPFEGKFANWTPDDFQFGGKQAIRPLIRRGQQLISDINHPGDKAKCTGDKMLVMEIKVLRLRWMGTKNTYRCDGQGRFV